MITNQVLAVFPFFCRLSPESRRLADASVKLITAGKGKNLLRKGDRIRGVYLILSGRLRVYAITAEGGEATLYTIEAGETCPLAMNAILGDKGRVHHTWIGVDSKSVRICFVPLAVFKDLYENERAVREFALGVLSGRISALMLALEELSLKPVGVRLKGHLLRHADGSGVVEATHQEIATALGTAREVVSRNLRELGRAGMIRTHRGRISLLKLRGGAPA